MHIAGENTVNIGFLSKLLVQTRKIVMLGYI